MFNSSMQQSFSNAIEIGTITWTNSSRNARKSWQCVQISVIDVVEHSHRKRFSLSRPFDFDQQLEKSQMDVRLRRLLKTVKWNRLMIVNVWSLGDEDEMRHVYSPTSSSDTSDKINDQVHAYLNDDGTIVLSDNNNNKVDGDDEGSVTYGCSNVNRLRSALFASSSVFATSKRPVGP